MRKFDYNYSNLKDGQTSQYEEKEFIAGEPVDAVYIRAPTAIDNGNPFVEALPRPRMNLEVSRDYEIGLEISKGPKDDYTVLSEISSLKSLRFKLPFHQKLETETYTCLINSYRSREFLIGSKDACKLIGNTYDAATDGFNLLGESGSGKSSALKILLSRYPQVINHHLDGVGDFKQIVYVVVSTLPNDNFSALYLSIAKAVDNALGFIEPVFEEQMKKRHSLGEKSLLIENLIERFNIGMILIDEIQLMSFASSKENSYTSLAKLSNDTKVSISTIGLSEATKKMFQQEWTARRLGSSIQADLYCENYEYFKLNLAKLLRYNWLKNPIEITEEGTAKLFELTNGAIAHLVSFYMRVQFNNFNRDVNIVLTGTYVEDIMNKYFSGLTKILSKKKTKKKEVQKYEIERTKIIKESNECFEKELDKKIQEAEIQKQIIDEKAGDKNKEYLELVEFVTRMIKIFDSTKQDKEIIDCLDSVIKTCKKNNKELSNEDALALTLEKLKQPKKSSRKKANNNPQQVSNFLS